MKKKWWKFGVLGIGLFVLIAGSYYFSTINRYQTEGKATLKGLSSAAREKDNRGPLEVSA